jgi:hypothetical protein
MPEWTNDDLDRIGGAEELQLAARGADGTLSTFTTMWVVRAGDHLYVRSAYGPGSVWYRRARAAGEGRVRADRVDRDVAFVDVPEGQTEVHEAVDAAYHAKYDRHGPGIVGTVVGPEAAALTIRLDPQP